VPTPSSTAQHARQALADRLREIRLDAGLTARELAAAAGWHESKCSRIEHGKTAPSDTDLRTWCAACGASGLADELIGESRAADSQWLDWRRMERTGLRHAQESVRELYERTRLFRFYSCWMIPGPVQTPDYVAAILTAIQKRRDVPGDDVEAAVAERIDRQHIVRDGGHQFVIVLEEGVLHYRIAPPDVLAGQLGHLLAVASMPSVKLGIIPVDADRGSMWPVESFFLFDNVQVNIELVSGFLTITQPREIVMYEQGFTELAQVAVYGKHARALIAAAINAVG
jgi:transcriptional regulator with XRE-family HTH domain